MHCHRCGHDNLSEARFCTECGNALAHACSECGSSNPAASKFCGQCGHALAAITAGSAPTPSPSVAPHEPERRQLTVMFCDLVGSTSLSQRLDPEDLREVLRAYQGVCAEVVKRFDGHIVQYLGDGVLVYFGHPHAHEDDPVRAGHAALEVLEAMVDLNDSLESEHGVRLAVRLGIHTGPTVISDVGARGRSERLAIGETPNLAARIQDEAKPDTVVVSDATYRLVKGFFVTEELGPRALKGIDRETVVFRLIAGSGARSRLEARGFADLSPLVGRETEMRHLMERWEMAVAGSGQIVTLSGEAGMGKSRLVEAFKERLATSACRLFESSCSPFHENTAWFAVVDMVQSWCGYSPAESARGNLRRLEEAVAVLPGANEETVSLLAGLLALPLPEGHPAPSLDAAGQRRRTMEILLEILSSSAAKEPVLWVMQDVHWADPSTLEVLERWSEAGRNERMMVLLNFRPEFSPPWSAAHVTGLELKGLDHDEAIQVIANVTGGKHLPPEVVARIAERTDGIPLFIEETTKALLESGHLVETADGFEVAGSLPATAIAPTLRDALTARLDRLGPGKALVQLAAVVGRRFSVELLHAVSGLEGWSALQAELARIVEAGVLVRTGIGAGSTYLFRHALMQDAAYESLLRKTRRSHHQRIKEVLEQRFPETARGQPELLAHHCTNAGATAEAVPYWLTAGRNASGRGAFAEAIHHLGRGLELLERLPPGPERDHYELWLQTDLGGALQASRGYAAPEVDEAYTRARDLGRSVGTPEELLPLLRGQHLYYTVRADYQTAGELSEHILRLAEQTGDPVRLMEAYMSKGTVALYVGDLLESRRSFEEALSRYDPAQGKTSEADLYIGQPATMVLSYLARTLWILGEVDRAMDLSLESLQLAERLAIPVTRAQTLGMHALLHLVRGENEEASEYTTQTIAYSTKHGLPYWAMLGSMYRAWLLAQDGQVDAGISDFETYLAGYRATGARLGLTWFLLVLAEMRAQNGEIARAFEHLDQAKSCADETEERYYEAELHRVQGELHLLSGIDHSRGAAEACFRRAIDVARAQHARSWELRAAMSLGRLWAAEDNRGDAHHLLSGAFDRFDQGLETPDLRNAQALLRSWAPA